jgi:uncharacterized membrane protein YgdD (TMEM256/DUF423 family)
MRTFFGLAAILAGLAVVLGAFGAHAFSSRIPTDRLETFEIGVRYQMYHALGLFVVAWAMDRWPGVALHVAGWLFVAGTVVFSGTLYGIAFGGPRWLGAITPVGGLCFIVGWVWLAVAAFRGGTG